MLCCLVWSGGCISPRRLQPGQTASPTVEQAGQASAQLLDRTAARNEWEQRGSNRNQITQL